LPLLIGTSGWHYKHWRGRLYPEGLPARAWLEHYAERFATVELNNAFYRLPERGGFDRWAAVLPDGFTVAVKASRYLTHIRRLREPEEPVSRLMDRAQGLGAKLGPVLLQLPPNLAIDLDALDRTLRAFPRHVRVAVEPRHASWWTDESRRLLERHGAALCLADADGLRTPLWATAEWGYVRLHHGRASPESCYGRSAITTWASRLADLWPGTADVYAYLNNDGCGCAPHDARRLALAAARARLTPTRVPDARDVRIG
jgi:uncharacterized protein YecE (DUF72 family)